MKLFSRERTFSKFSGFSKQVFTAFFLMPTGILYFILLDVLDVFFTAFIVAKVLCQCKDPEGMLQ